MRLEQTRVWPSTLMTTVALAVGLVVRVSGLTRGAEEGLLARYRAAGFSLDSARSRVTLPAEARAVRAAF